MITLLAHHSAQHNQQMARLSLLITAIFITGALFAAIYVFKKLKD